MDGARWWSPSPVQLGHRIKAASRQHAEAVKQVGEPQDSAAASPCNNASLHRPPGPRWRRQAGNTFDWQHQRDRTLIRNAHAAHKVTDSLLQALAGNIDVTEVTSPGSKLASRPPHGSGCTARLAPRDQHRYEQEVFSCRLDWFGDRNRSGAATESRSHARAIARSAGSCARRAC